MRNKLGDLIASLGLSRADEAEGVGVSRQALWRYTNGTMEPTRPVVQRAIDFLNRPENLDKLGRSKPVTFEEVFGGEAKWVSSLR